MSARDAKRTEFQTYQIGMIVKSRERAIGQVTNRIYERSTTTQRIRVSSGIELVRDF